MRRTKDGYFRFSIRMQEDFHPTPKTGPWYFLTKGLTFGYPY